MKATNKVANVRDEFKPFGKHPSASHPRPRLGKTAKEWKANPNKEKDRYDRQWLNAANSHKWCGSLRHKV